MTKIRIVIADDHPIFAGGLRHALSSDDGMEVVGEARDGEAAIQQIRACLPDVVILDVDMPKKDGLQVVRAMAEQDLFAAVIFLTMHKNQSLFDAALDLGVRGYVLKDSAMSEAAESVKAVAAGHNFVSPALTTHLFAQRSRRRSLHASHPGLDELTPSERRIFRLIAGCKSNAEIAEELCLSIRTVEHHRAHICSKLNLHGREALLRFALSHHSELA